MNSRQEQLLKYVIDSHVATGEPVGSTSLVAGYDLGVSSATVRSDLLALEEEGYLAQPHTSAGRVPTEAGYRYYINHLQLLPSISAQEQKTLQHSTVRGGDERRKELARALAVLTHETVIVALRPGVLYYTGVKNLFTKPEFSENAEVVALSEILDNIDECFGRLRNTIMHEVTAHIGTEGAFGEACSTVSIRVAPDTVYVLLGPMRMRYDHNIALLKELQKLF